MNTETQQKQPTRKYKVWMSATSTINTTLEVEAKSPEHALEIAEELAQHEPHKINWYYEGSGSVELDDKEIWPVDEIIPPPPQKTPVERLRDLCGPYPFTVVAEKRYYRLFAGMEDITSAVALNMGLKTQMSAGKQKCDADQHNPKIVAREVLTRLCEKIGREVGDVIIL